MKITVLMDSFKGSLTSEEAGNAVKAGIEASGIDADVTVFPFADGGEGTLDAFLKADKRSKKVKVIVSDPLGRKIEAYYGVRPLMSVSGFAHSIRRAFFLSIFICTALSQRSLFYFCHLLRGRDPCNQSRH